MNKTSLLWLAGCGLTLTAQAQEATPHHFGFGLPVWLNAHANFSTTRATDPGPNDGSSIRNRTYDDGYNKVDSTGNTAPPGGVASTANFGYANASQVGATSLFLHSAQINGGDSTGRLDNQPFPGLDLFYRYDLKQGKTWSFGIESGAAYQYFKWEQSGALNSTADVITDAYALGGVALPAASYDGHFTWLPGDKIIGSTPVRTESTVPATVTGSRELQMHALQFRLGPTLDWKPNAQWQLGWQTGVALGVGFSTLSYADQIAYTDQGGRAVTLKQNGSSDATHVWAGWFNALRLTRHLSDRWDLHVEARNVLQNSLNHRGGQRSANMNLSDALALGLGLSYIF